MSLLNIMKKMTITYLQNNRFPEGSLYTNTNDEGWKMIRVGDAPLGFGQCLLKIEYLLIRNIISEVQLLIIKWREENNI